MSKKQQQLSILDIDSGNFGQGGRRQGSGRKKREKTEVIRVPASLVDEFKQRIAQYKKEQQVSS
ncbi:hypothetical protein [Vibrio sp. SCSIO 43136]|uniref:hypothetical protein n=1 Tax=Vibrio sp. SCSIO 43136 TaxID=2819101 RepID=UPI0020750F12|nr:hypothetical protein [Vibrio sp. SCSIO 43136]USD64190.1 hypothetical protein J4N39_08710 [Vibrio sp. SCSIO 43136]